MGVQQPDDFLREDHPGWFPLRYANAIKSLSEYELVGLCDINADLLSQAGLTLSVDKLYLDHRNLFLEVEIDVLVVATRTPGRSQIILDAVNAGIKAIHAEKPLGRSLAECQISLDAVEAQQIPLTLGTIRRYMETYRTAKRMVNEGKIGKLLGITVEYGPSSLMWTHPHSIDLLVYFSGTTNFDFVRASMAFDTNDIHPGVLDCDPIVEDCQIRFSNGVNGTINRNEGDNLWLSGSEATILISNDGAQLKIMGAHNLDETDVKPKIVDIEFKMSATQRLLFELARAVRTGICPSITTREINAVHRIIFGAALSAMAGGKPMTFQDIPREFTVTSRTAEKTA